MQFVRADAAGWRGKSLTSLRDINREQFLAVLDTASLFKQVHDARQVGASWDYPRTLAAIFEKPSLRTRVSFEAGMNQMGGHSIYLAPSDVGLGKRESVQDVASGLSRWVDVISARVFAHATVTDLAKYASVPVINALSDQEHPIQAFADILALQRHKGAPGNNLKLTYVGDGNNVLHSLLLACAMLGIHISAGCPAGYWPDPAYVSDARALAAQTGATVEIVEDPAAAVEGADALYTDVWASMGQESEHAARVKIFRPYQINAKLLTYAKPDAIVLHCLPAHPGEEISVDVFEANRIPIFDEAENRLHTQKALIALMVGM